LGGVTAHGKAVNDADDEVAAVKAAYTIAFVM
jgi:hypothetical protein